MKIGMLLIATNNYKSFLQPLIESADRFFLKGYDVEYFIFTDDADLCPRSCRPINIEKINHREWPWMTLGRYGIFTAASCELSKMDYLYYCDADMLFVGDVGAEILSPLTATTHPGFCGGRGVPETNPSSTAYVSPSEDMIYFAGGFNGGSSSEYLKMAGVLSRNILTDQERGITAIWHDESHLNRYLINSPPTKILDPGYCYPESRNLPYTRRLLALDKDHSKIRKNKD